MFKIYHKVNWKSSFIIYLLECYICNIHYIGKSDTPFNIRINNRGKDVKNPNLIPTCKHFNRHGHDFNNKIHHHRATNKHTWNINWDNVKMSRSSNLRLSHRMVWTKTQIEPILSILCQCFLILHMV